MNIFLFFLAGLISSARCGENSVSINVKTSINSISDNFISYNIDFLELLEKFGEKKSLNSLNFVSPAFIKLRGLPAYLNRDGEKSSNETVAALLLHNLNSLKITPVIVIDYSTTNFNPIALLNDLKNARDLKIEKCIWQLGESDIKLDNSLQLNQYSNDLKTLKILCESVKKENQLNWEVAAVGSSSRTVDMLPFNVAAYDLKKIASAEILSTSTIGTIKTSAPKWVTIEQSSDDETTDEVISMKNNETCGHECLMSGLLHAQVLGEAAKKGISALFFNESLSKSSTSGFKRAVSILHKKLVGSKVFNVRVTKASTDGKLTNLYSHCSKKTDGALTLMGINFSNMRSKLNIKISSPMDTNAIIMQYMLSASDGRILLNNEGFNSEAIPAYKFKKLSKFTISLVLPPFSMAFWTVKNAKVSECLRLSEVTVKSEISQLTSSADQLLKTLAANEFEGKRSNAIEKKIRSKRQLSSVDSYLPKFEFELPFKFPNLMTSASNHRPIKDVFFNKNTDVYKVASVDDNPLPPSDNPTLPNGDVYLLINDGKDFMKPDDTEYIIEDHEQPKRSKTKDRKNSNNRIVVKEAEDEPEYFNPYDYVDASYKTTKKASKKATKKEQPKEVGELFEAEGFAGSSNRNSRVDDQMRSPSHNIELKTVVRELEPTYRQSKTALLAAKRKWDRNQIMELLKDAHLEEVDKAQIEDAEDFEVIDLTQNADVPNYEEYEGDDDGFFTDDEKLHLVRSRRHVDYTKNEIPKFGAHVIDEDDDSIESLIDDAHMFLPPRNENGQQDVEFHEATQAAVQTEKPLTIKAVDFFSKSLNDVVGVAHRTFVGWWNVFSPPKRF